jgi:hypothetical protein
MQKRQPLNARARKRFDRAPLTVRDVLEALAGTRGSLLERVCWDLNVDESRVRPAWEAALRRDLLEPAGVDRLTGRAMHRLSDRGRDALRGARRARTGRMTEGDGR